MACIYKITNLINNKLYIGKTSCSLEKRFQEHINDSKYPGREKRPLYEAFHKYGIENFKIELVEDNLTDDEATQREIFWIANYQTYIGFDNCNGYNATLGGDSKHTYDYKALSDKYLELKQIKKVAEYFHCDPETVRKACKDNNIEIIKHTNRKQIYCVELNQYYESISAAGKIFTPDNPNKSRANISRALQKNTTAYGYHWRFVDK